MRKSATRPRYRVSQWIRAAEIRALRDWLVPEEEADDDDSFAVIPQGERQRLRALLTAEADRAERQ